MPVLNWISSTENRLIACADSNKWFEPIEGESFPVIPATLVRDLAISNGRTGSRRLPYAHPSPLLIRGALITGELNLQGMTLSRTIWFENCRFDGFVHLSDCVAKTLSFTKSHLPKGLRARRMQVKGSLFLNGGFVADDEVDLDDVSLDGNLECTGGTFNTAPDRQCALTAIHARVGGSVNLNSDDRLGKFIARGKVTIDGANIEGDLECAGGFFEKTFQAQGLSCRGLYLNNGFTGKGPVDFMGLFARGQVSCRGGNFLHECANWKEKEDEDDFSLRLRFAEIGSGLLFDKAESGISDHPHAHATICGILDLSHAKCVVYRDSRDSWPPPGKLQLDGFTYEHFHDCPTDWETRRDWLKLQQRDSTHGTFHPQPWTQTIKVLRDTGCDLDSRKLAICREVELARSNRWTISLERGALRKLFLNIPGLWNGFLRYAVGYGYEPWRALYWSLGFFAFGWLVFATAANLGYMAPRESSVQIHLTDVPLNGSPKRHLPQEYPRFNAPLYALDVYLPIIELGPDKAWEPSDVQIGHRRNTKDDGWTQFIRLVLGHDWTTTGVRAEKARARSSQTEAYPAFAR